MQEMNQNDILALKEDRCKKWIKTIFFLFGKFENLPHLVMKQYFAVSFKCPKKGTGKKTKLIPIITYNKSSLISLKIKIVLCL